MTERLKKQKQHKKWDEAARSETDFCCFAKFFLMTLHKMSRRESQSTASGTFDTEAHSKNETHQCSTLDQRCGNKPETLLDRLGAFSLMVCEGRIWAQLYYNEMSVLRHDWRAASLASELQVGGCMKARHQNWQCRFVAAPKNSWGRSR